MLKFVEFDDYLVINYHINDFCLQILQDLGVRTMRLMTNNPAKYSGLKGYGLSIVEKVTLPTLITKENKRYLETKRLKMGHVYGSEFNGQLSALIKDVEEASNQQQAS